MGTLVPGAVGLPGSLAREMTTGGTERDGEERPLRRAPQLAVMLEGGDRKGLLHDMTAAILRHGGDIVLVEIIERGTRSVVYWELDGIDDPEGLMRVVPGDRRGGVAPAAAHHVPGLGQADHRGRGGAQVGQVVIGASARPTGTTSGARGSGSTRSRSSARGPGSAVRAVARLPRAVALVVAGSMMGGEVTKAVDEVRARGILVVSLNMAGRPREHADLVVTDPVQAGVMTVMAIASTASFDIDRVRGHRF